MNFFKRKLLSTTVAALLVASPAYGDTADTEAGSVGRLDTTGIPGSHRLPSVDSEKFRVIEFRGSAGITLGCDGIGITNMFDEVVDNLELVFDNFASNAMGLAINMLIYSQPTMYQLLENLNISLRDMVEMNITTCQGIRDLAEERMKPIISKAKDKCITDGHTKAYCDDGKKLIPYVNGLNEEEKQSLIRLEDMGNMITFSGVDMQNIGEAFGYYGTNEWEADSSPSTEDSSQNNGATGDGAQNGQNSSGATEKTSPHLPKPAPIKGSNLRILECSAPDPIYAYFSSLVPDIKIVERSGKADTLEPTDRSLTLEALIKPLAEGERNRILDAVTKLETSVDQAGFDAAVADTGSKQAEPLSPSTLRNLATLKRADALAFSASVASIANNRAHGHAKRLVHMYEFAVNNAASSTCTKNLIEKPEYLVIAREGIVALKNEMAYIEAKEASASMQRMTEIAINNAVKDRIQQIQDDKADMMLR